MHYFILSLVLVVISQQIFITDADLCKVYLATIPSPEPVYLIPIVGSKATTYEPLKPTGEFTLLSEGTEIRTFCPGSGNVLQSLRENSLDLVCGPRDNWQTSSGAKYKLQDLPCQSIPSSDLKLTSEKCGANRRGYIYEAGFRIDDRNFATIFQICYDNVTETTLYTQNTINGAAINYSITEDTRRAFRANGMRFTTKAANNFYTIKNQIERFESYFGKQQNYVHPRMFLARGHLSPDADFIFGYEQLATYFYANVAPEFQSVNAGNWLRVENLARKLAADFNDDLETYNGYMGLLKLPHPKTHTPVAIFLDKEQHMPVPEYFFKVIMHEVSNAAIVMISLNNPFATNPKEKEFCINVCHEADLYSKHFEDASRGYTFCCELNDFRRFYEDLPIHLSANCLLHKNGRHICGKHIKKIIEAKEDLFAYTVEEEEEIDPETLKENNACSITMPDDIASPEPVYILTTSDNPKPRLLRPTGPITSIPIGSSLTLVCAGAGNTLANLNEQSLELICQEDSSFYSFSLKQNIQLPEMNCARIPTPDILLTSKRCAAGKGYIFQPGYFMGTEFVDAFDICYDNKTQQNLYSIDIINGATQNFKINKISRRTFRADGLQATTSATNTIYTLNNQVERFEKYFGSDQQYINKSMFLARGHLAPDADFIFGYEQVATYYYANVAPQFQIVNSANWIRVENIARNLATLYSSDLLVITGTYGLLQLPVGKRKKVAGIYLDDAETVPVPKWLYKILLHPKLNADIVMITLNNPYAQSKDIEEFCPNVCEKYGLDSTHFKDLSRGYTFCCNLKDFNAALIELPVFDLPDGWKFKAT